MLLRLKWARYAVYSRDRLSLFFDLQSYKYQFGSQVTQLDPARWFDVEDKVRRKRALLATALLEP